MIRKDIIKKTVCIFLVASFSILSFAGVGASSETYKYEKKDKAQEQRRFVARLREDKKKVEMAIESTKTLIERSRNRSYLPELYLRLSELYVEKSRIIYFLRKAQAMDSVKSLDHLESNILKNKAIETYQRILINFPNFQHRDKVHFFMAHEYRELGEIDEMVKHYRAIIAQYADSPYVPEAYLLLGDYFFNMQDLDMAKRHYEAVLKYPQSSAISVARYKLAWCHINNTEFKEAIELFEESVTSASDKQLDIDTYRKKVNIKLEALIDMAYCYPECYKESKPEDAIAYFHKFAWSRPVYATALEKLAYRYLIKKKWSHASLIYRQLSVLQHDAEKLLEYSRKIFECVRAMDTFEDADKDMAYIVKALRKQRYSVHIPQEEKEKNLTDYELYARDIVTHLHHKARENSSVSNFKVAADSYKQYLDFFHDSPVYEDMEANYAEALFSAKQFLDAGKKYEKLASRIPHKNKEKEEHLYGAVISYYNALKNKENLNYYKVVFARGGLKTAGNSYISDFPESDRVPNVLFNVAWITHDEGKYNEAITKFSEFVERYPNGKEAKIAVHLILDTFNMKEDYEGLINYGHKVLSNQRIGDGELKQEVEKIVQASESKVISSFTVAAVNNWEEGKTNLIEYAEQKKSTGLGEEALNALVVSGKEKGDLETVFLAGSKLITQYPTSSKVENTLGVLIDSCVKTSQFRMVAEYLEEFSNKLPKHKNTTDFLYQAGNIRTDLGQYDPANKDYQMLLDTSHNAGHMHEKIIFAMADNAERMGNIDYAIKVLSGKTKFLSQVGKVKADARIANLYFQNGKPGKAGTYRKKAYEAYKSKHAKKDGMLNSIMAKTTYDSIQMSNEKYMGMQLNDKIDNKVVAAKAKLMGKLEKGYHTVMQYQSPEWALRACYRSYEINKEFARFLREAPLPELTPEEKVKYLQIIEQKAKAYAEKADQYLQTGIKQAHKWEVCDPELAIYYKSPSDTSGQLKGLDFFSESGSSVEIAAQWLRDEDLRSLHYKMMEDPNDVSSLLALADAYRERKDYRHSILLARKALSEIEDKEEHLKADVYNFLGVSYLYTQDDIRAKDAFKKALTINSEAIGPRINLAGLYSHYGHVDKANNFYDTLPDNGIVEDSGALIHPRAKEFYYVHFRSAKK